LEDALSDIKTLRSQLARSTRFRGYSASAFATTGLLAIGAAGLQSALLPGPDIDLYGYVALWAITAALAVAIIGIDVVAPRACDHIDANDGDG